MLTIQSHSSPFMKLPLELRRDVYQRVLLPRVIFAVRRSSPKRPRVEWVRDPTHHIWTHATPPEEKLDEFTVTAKPFDSTPSLFLVNRKISAEATEALSALYTLLGHCAHFGTPEESTDPVFLSLIEGGRFDFYDDAEITLSFLKKTSESTRLAIRSMLFALHIQASEDSLLNSDNPSLPQLVPCLQEIAVYGPSWETDVDRYDGRCSYSGGDNCARAGLTFLDLGVIDTLRILFAEPVPGHRDVKDRLVRWAHFDFTWTSRSPGMEYFLSDPHPPEPRIRDRFIVSREKIMLEALPMKGWGRRAGTEAAFALRRKGGEAAGV